MTIGESMRNARKKAGMTLSELAEKSGWRSRQISTWERDKYQPRLNAVVDLADTLGISVDEYVGRIIPEAEKNIPKKPIENFPFAVCANCGEGVREGMNYCYKCGQALDWSDTK